MAALNYGVASMPSVVSAASVQKSGGQMIRPGP